MSEVVAIVEGQTERTFVHKQLAPHLMSHGITMWAVLSGPAGKHGGIKRWPETRKDIVRTLKGGNRCTTMFDYYAMPDSWPGRVASRALPWQERAKHVEAEMLADISMTMGEGFNPAQFIPYVQLHEFEALAFADVKVLTEVTAPLANGALFRIHGQLLQYFQEILNEAGNPEAINDGYETCPSRRIVSKVAAYRKPVHGIIVTNRIGLDVLRARCSHFANWIARLEAVRG